MNKKIIDSITYMTMFIMAMAILLMRIVDFPIIYSYIIIIFASIVLILRLGNRIYMLITKKK